LETQSKQNKIIEQKWHYVLYVHSDLQPVARCLGSKSDTTKKESPPNRSTIPRMLEGDSSKPQIVAVSLRGSLAGNNRGYHTKSDSLVNWRL
jgi:hypothetical protein